MMGIDGLIYLKPGKSRRISSFDKTGRNADYILVLPGVEAVLADIAGPGKITHIWMTQPSHYREVLLAFYWDDADYPSVLCPLGDFFCLGHSIVNSFDSLPFSASTNYNNSFEKGCALNCYLPMPFRKRAVIKLINESEEVHMQYYHIDYEIYGDGFPEGDIGYFHAEFRRALPFGGWGPEVPVNSPEADIPNKEEEAWRNNYVILETEGRGHYIGCNLSVTNFSGKWWGEGDDMIWVDGYKWPPDLHGTGSEDYFCHAWGMQKNAFMRCGSSIHEDDTGGYQTSYVFHIENPIRFNRSIKVTIEVGHANHLGNEVSSVAYWYSDKPARVNPPPPVELRKPVIKKDGKWIIPRPDRTIELTDIMKYMKNISEKIRNGFAFYRAGPLTIKDGTVYIKIPLVKGGKEEYPLSLAELSEDIDGLTVTVGFYGDIVPRINRSQDGRPIRVDPFVPDRVKRYRLGAPIRLIKGVAEIDADDDIFLIGTGNGKKIDINREIIKFIEENCGLTSADGINSLYLDLEIINNGGTCNVNLGIGRIR